MQLMIHSRRMWMIRHHKKSGKSRTRTTKMLLFILLLATVFCYPGYSQKKYAYAVLYLRCGNKDPQRNSIYYSPVIELNLLNFDRYTYGMDPSFPKYSVQYYTYAIDKWFEIYLYEHYNIRVNDPEKYERDATSVVLDDKNKADCNDDKTGPGCFFTDKEKLEKQRQSEIRESKLPKLASVICEVIDL